MDKFIEMAHSELLPNIDIESEDPHDPIVVRYVPGRWRVIGAGNYAAVLVHPDYPDRVLKLYAPGRPGWEDEVEVYRRLGKHPAYAECFHANGEYRYLVLRRLYGTTFYDCIKQGVRIPEQAIQDIDEALDYARERGLHPHDVHGKNVMLDPNGRGIVVDVSDFLKDEPCTMWDDVKKAYYKIYLPFMYDHPLPVPDFLMNSVRKGYRWLRKGDLWGSDS
ncbi:serine/threonine protein kinase [Paenibacillus thermotolerans]|uniref:serine/threonine protein kinase n=1 Tax=Paenibacillus thermotolerans TaxID=3027807 RepID=UPI0023677E69|nr:MULTISPECIES: serine/threonine protein kinase [unclassified Paenibacillus]